MNLDNMMNIIMPSMSANRSSMGRGAVVVMLSMMNTITGTTITTR